MILLNPGPVSLTPRVRQALAGDDLCHREPECAEMLQQIRQKLDHVYPDTSSNHESILLTGSGTAAVEAMLASLAPRDSGTLVLCNGVYGERMADMLARQSKPHERLQHSWESAWDMASIERLLEKHPSITHVAAVHHETTTGRLNNLPALAELAERRGIKILLDAVSSFAGEPIDWAAWSLEAVAATANKCVHGAPGVSFVFVEKSRLSAAESQSPSLYLDLFTYHTAQAKGDTPFTPSVPTCRALLTALHELEETDGWRSRHERYQQLSRSLRDHLATLGVSALIPSTAAAATLTAFPLPDHIDHQEWHDYLKANGFIIYGGQGKYAENIFRIANMGAISDADWKRLFEIITDYFQRNTR